ncbi:MAG: hypothetical protein AAGF11_46390 [Myxococcota bacterium]
MNSGWILSWGVSSLIVVGCTDEPPDSEPLPAASSGSIFDGSGPGPGDSAGSTGTQPPPGTSADSGDPPPSGSSGDPPPDDSSGDPPSDDPCAGADILCDDFEDPAGLDPQWAYTGNPANMPVLDDGRAFAGSRSLTFPNTDTQGAFVYPAAGLPTADNRIYVRAYVSFARPMSEMGGHVSYIVGADQPANGVELRLGASQNFGNGQMMIDVNLLGAGPEYTQFANGDVTGGAPSGARGVSLLADTWYCMEALYDGAAHEFRLWVDGVELPGMHVTDWQAGLTDWSPSYAVMKIGGQNYSGSLGQIWFDDVAMGTQPLGCP